MLHKTEFDYLATLQEESEKVYDYTHLAEEICGWELSSVRFSLTHAHHNQNIRNRSIEVGQSIISNSPISLRHKPAYASKIRSRDKEKKDLSPKHVSINTNIKFKLIHPIEIKEIKNNLPQIKPYIYSPNFMLAAKDATFEGFLKKCKVNIKDPSNFRMKSASPNYFIRRKNYYS